MENNTNKGQNQTPLEWKKTSITSIFHSNVFEGSKAKLIIAKIAKFQKSQKIAKIAKIAKSQKSQNFKKIAKIQEPQNVMYLLWYILLWNV